MSSQTKTGETTNRESSPTFGVNKNRPTALSSSVRCDKVWLMSGSHGGPQGWCSACPINTDIHWLSNVCLEPLFSEVCVCGCPVGWRAYIPFKQKSRLLCLIELYVFPLPCEWMLLWRQKIIKITEPFFTKDNVVYWMKYHNITNMREESIFLLFTLQWYVYDI